ncbi:hypothetical protein SI65_04423 [Aspergillus cristatus]|uniref:Uncharacterized protein n=1 Tax=Aspergillus cristatus TaxID=573508 RepID=A0A1E3BES3_ASPCR|nr:hypothetical protein SI65_04423 [Aspergillus cristatus]
MSSRHSGSHGGSLEEKVLSDDVTSFENAGLMTPLVNQKWKVAAKPSMAHQFDDIPSQQQDENLGYRPIEPIEPTTFANIQQDEVEVPEYLNSIETYELIGFNHNVAYDMWSRYITADPDSPYHFMGYARA